jgi:glycine cleavage system H protein
LKTFESSKSFQIIQSISKLFKLHFLSFPTFAVTCINNLKFLSKMNFPADLRYTSEHEWLRITEGNIAVIGVTDFAQSELGDIVFVEIETVGQTFAANDIFGTVEAVKTVSDLFLPVAGKIIEVNLALGSNPELVNNDPYGEGWMVKVEVTNLAEIETLMDSAAYQNII